MYERFIKAFVSDDSDGSSPSTASATPDPWLNELLATSGGRSFNRGLYRIVTPGDLATWRERVEVGFPEFANRVVCFGYDWLGRVFALDAKRTEGGRPAILMFEPGQGEALQVPRNLQSFHDEELVEFRNDVLAEEYFASWLKAGGAAPKPDQCIGYKNLIFLGGEDALGNLELSDIDVYWSIAGQLRAKTRPMKAGQRIGKVTIED
jgi:hypothetical protein